MNREYDIIVYGASGYTAKHVVKELICENIKMALSSRCSAAIRKNLSEIKGIHSVPIYECPAENIRSISSRTKIILNCAGPYILSGEEVIQACIDTETHYLDISGETFFIEQILKKYDEEASRKNIYIINCCGFDSIPADVGTEYLKSRLGCDIEIFSLMKLKNIEINKTTYESLIYGLQNMEKLKSLRNKSKTRPISSIKKYFYNHKTMSYNVIFMGTDPSVVKRTQTIMKEKGFRSAKYLAYLDVGNYYNLLIFKIYFLLFMFLCRFKIGQYILKWFPSFFTFGIVKASRPKDEKLKKSSFEIIFFGKSLESSKEIKMCITGPDPGYITTSICLSQASLCLLDILKGRGSRVFSGGVLTPGCAFHNTDLVDRLKKKGINFNILTD